MELGRIPDVNVRVEILERIRVNFQKMVPKMGEMCTEKYQISRGSS